MNNLPKKAFCTFSLTLVLVLWMTLHSEKNSLMTVLNHFGPSEDRKKQTLRYCTRSQVRTGQWINSSDRLLYGVGGDICLNEKYDPLDVYEWQPSKAHGSCRFEKFNRTTFCSLMKEAPILFIGDSLSFEHWGSLVESLGGKMCGRLQFKKGNNFIVTQSVCSKDRTFLLFKRQDDLHNLEVFIQKKFPVVIVMNRGAHYVENDVLVSELKSTFQHVSNWQKQCADYGIKCHFFWRTTVPGHPSCENYRSPVNNISLVEEMIANDATSIKFNWNKFKAQNQLVLRLLESSNISDYDVIDAYEINILRPDQHTRARNDCLHSCRPGKVDVYNQVMQHVLVQKRTEKDVEQLENLSFPWNRTRNVHKDGRGVLFYD